MKKVPYMLLAVLVLVMFQSATVAAAAERTLTGEFWWEESGRGGDLRSVFTPTGEGTWDVVFYFRFHGESHVYRGTAEGSLSRGALRGTVLDKDRERTFTFEGAFKNGEFAGTHSEVFSGGAEKTGTLTLS